jgi:hypothetical protein
MIPSWAGDICPDTGGTAGFESGFSNVVCVLGGQDVTSVLSQGENGGGGGCFISIAKDN